MIHPGETFLKDKTIPSKLRITDKVFQEQPG